MRAAVEKAVLFPRLPPYNAGMKRLLPLYLTAAAFLALVLLAPRAAEGARQGLSVCAAALLPSLFPFFALSNLLSGLGLAELLSGAVGKAVERLFRVSACGAQAFLLGVTGGYPLGAHAVAELRRKELVSRDEAERLLAFCNNSGPAFILGAAGGVFHSPGAGALLYCTHLLGAACVGLVFRGRGAPPVSPHRPPDPPRRFAEAFPSAVSGALASTLTVCGYVVLFSALLGCVPPLASLPPLPRALLTGFAELGGGVAALRGLPASPTALATAALLLGWGGLSVHAQTLSAAAGTDISCARHLAGRALCGVFAAIFTYASALLLQYG